MAAELARVKTPAEASARVEQEIHLILSELSGYSYSPEVYRRRANERSGLAREDDEG
jgi:hypothetical protein